MNEFNEINFQRQFSTPFNLRERYIRWPKTLAQVQKYTSSDERDDESRKFCAQAVKSN